MRKSNWIILAWSLLVFSTCLFTALYGQNNLYDRIGINVEHGSHGAVPEENIDLSPPQVRHLIWEGFNHYDMAELPRTGGWMSVRMRLSRRAKCGRPIEGTSEIRGSRAQLRKQT